MATQLMTGDRTGLMRSGRLVLLLLHLFVAGVAPFADAILEADQERTAHVESERDTACGYGHAHALCQICRVVGLNALPGIARHAWSAGSSPIAVSAPYRPDLAGPGWAAFSPNIPRAPPIEAPFTV